jgi:hypothetical protein
MIANRLCCCEILLLKNDRKKGTNGVRRSRSKMEEKLCDGVADFRRKRANGPTSLGNSESCELCGFRLIIYDEMCTPRARIPAGHANTVTTIPGQFQTEMHHFYSTKCSAG